MSLDKRVAKYKRDAVGKKMSFDEFVDWEKGLKALKKGIKKSPSVKRGKMRVAKKPKKSVSKVKKPKKRRVEKPKKIGKKAPSIKKVKPKIDILIKKIEKLDKEEKKAKTIKKTESMRKKKHDAAVELRTELEKTGDIKKDAIVFVDETVAIAKSKVKPKPKKKEEDIEQLPSKAEAQKEIRRELKKVSTGDWVDETEETIKKDIGILKKLITVAYRVDEKHENWSVRKAKELRNKMKEKEADLVERQDFPHILKEERKVVLIGDDKYLAVFYKDYYKKVMDEKAEDRHKEYYEDDFSRRKKHIKKYLGEEKYSKLMERLQAMEQTPEGQYKLRIRGTTTEEDVVRGKRLIHPKATPGEIVEYGELRKEFDDLNKICNKVSQYGNRQKKINQMEHSLEHEGFTPHYKEEIKQNITKAKDKQKREQKGLKKYLKILEDKGILSLSDAEGMTFFNIENRIGSSQKKIWDKMDKVSDGLSYKQDKRLKLLASGWIERKPFYYYKEKATKRDLKRANIKVGEEYATTIPAIMKRIDWSREKVEERLKEEIAKSDEDSVMYEFNYGGERHYAQRRTRKKPTGYDENE